MNDMNDMNDTNNNKQFNIGGLEMTISTNREYKGKYKGYGRKTPYKEDSTKGGSLMVPVSYKGDVLVQVWMDSRVLATISQWLDTERNYTRFLSEVVKSAMQILCNHIVETEVVKMIDDTVDARTLLEAKYRVNLNPEGRGLKNKLHNITLSERRKELGDRIKVDSRVDTVYDSASESGSHFTTDEEWKRIQDRIKEEDEKERKAELEKAIALKNEVKVKPKAKSDIPKKLDDEEWRLKIAEIERKDRERIALENAPLDLEALKKNAVGGE